MSEPASPTRLGRYRLVRKLGRGGMATVYAAVQEGPHGFESEVAIKLVHPNLLREHPHVVRMVVDEARVASRIRHPNVVRIMDLCEEPPDVLYIVMDYVDGVSMRQVLDTARTLRNRAPLGPVLEVLAAACDGLHAAHKATQPDGTPLNLVHRDVKPGNILVSADGEVKVGDFGIAFFGDRRVEATGHGQMKGTPAYMSPEQVVGTPIDSRSDIFSMGLTLYTLATSKLAFAGETSMAMAMKLATESLEPHARELDELRLGLGDILRTACAKEPMARYPQAAAMAAELRALRDQMRVTTTVGEMVVASGWTPRRPDERPGEMASIDAGTVVDVDLGGPSPTVDTPVEPADFTVVDESVSGDTTDAPTDDGPLDTSAEEPTPQGPPIPTSEGGGGRSGLGDAPRGADGLLHGELLPPDPFARPVRSVRGARIEGSGNRPGVFESPSSGPPPVPPEPSGTEPRPSGPRPRAPGAPPRPPGPPPRMRGAPPGPPRNLPPGSPPGAARRPQQVLERDYRGRVIRKTDEPDSAGLGLVEFLGVGLAVAMLAVAVYVILNREAPPDPFAEEPVAALPVEVLSDPSSPAEEVAAGVVAPPPADRAGVEGAEQPPGAKVESIPSPSPVDASKVRSPDAPTTTLSPASVPKPAPTPESEPEPESESESESEPESATDATGMLTVNSYPWAEVHLNGVGIGNTPIKERSVPVGEHRVRLVFSVAGPDGAVPPPVERRVTIEEGAHEMILHRP